jgi:hypothetical protein
MYIRGAFMETVVRFNVTGNSKRLNNNCILTVAIFVQCVYSGDLNF